MAVPSTRFFSAPGDRVKSPTPNESFKRASPDPGFGTSISSVTSGPGVGIFGRSMLIPHAMLARAIRINAETIFTFIVDLLLGNIGWKLGAGCRRAGGISGFRTD